MAGEEVKDGGLKAIADELRRRGVKGITESDDDDDPLLKLLKAKLSGVDVKKIAIPFNPKAKGEDGADQLAGVINQILDEIAPSHQIELSAAGQVMIARAVKYKIHMTTCPVCGSDEGKKQFGLWLEAGIKALELLRSWDAKAGQSLEDAFQELKGLSESNKTPV